MREKENRLATK